ncbi:MAG: hypothetical protein KC503_42660, partial [Myxococcales bacterium]|nr:hypothetical protein [Myxococcales bacterium]
ARPRRAATAAAAASAATAAIATATAAGAPPVVAVTVLDWEFCGLYPRGWDLGLLWVGLRPDGRALLEQQLDAETRRDVDHATVLAAARELEVRRVSLRQAESHPLVQALVADLARARQRVD